MASLGNMVAGVLAEAQKQPQRASEIYTRAARRFRLAALDPRNARMAMMLKSVAEELAYSAAHPATVDDFDELTDERAQAHTEVGYAGDMEVHARMRQIQEAKDPTRHVSLAPESVDEETRLGLPVTVKYDPTAEEKQNNVKQVDTSLLWQGNKSRESMTFTVDVNVSAAPPVTTGVVCRPYGELQIGTDGYHSPPIRFDVGAGTRITAAGNYVSVVLGMLPPPTGKTSGKMTLGSSLGFFSAPSKAPVTYTWYLDDIPVSTGAVIHKIDRPTRAVSILPPQMSTTTANCLLYFYDSSGTIVGILDVPNGSVVAPIPLTNDVFQIGLENNGPDTTSYRLPFLLAL